MQLILSTGWVELLKKDFQDGGKKFWCLTGKNGEKENVKKLYFRFSCMCTNVRN